MKTNLSTLKIGEKALVKEVDLEIIPLKLIEMGCLPGNAIELLQEGPFGDPLYIKVHDSFVAIRKEVAVGIEITLTES